MMYRFDTKRKVWADIQLVVAYRGTDGAPVYAFLYPMSDGYLSFRPIEEHAESLKFAYYSDMAWATAPVVAGIRVYHEHGWVLPIPVSEEQRAQIICDLLSVGVAPTFWEGE